MDAAAKLSQIKTDSVLRPVMHLIKVLSPVIAAIQERRACGLDCLGPEMLTQQIDTVIDRIQAECQMPTPGEEWQRATIRAGILNFVVNDIKATGGIIPEKWLPIVCELIQTLNIHASPATPQNKPAMQVKLTLADCTTKLLDETHEFAFFHPQKALVKNLIDTIFHDSKRLLTQMGGADLPESANLMSNLLTNHTTLMLGALRSEGKRVQETVSEADILNHPNGLPLEGLTARYKSSTEALCTLLGPASFDKAPVQDNFKTPHFLKP